MVEQVHYISDIRRYSLIVFVTLYTCTVRFVDLLDETTGEPQDCWSLGAIERLD